MKHDEVDDRGFRLAKLSYEANRTTWYIRDASGNVISIYEQEGIVTSDTNGVPLVNSEPLDQTEVPVYGSGKLGIFYPGQNGATVYEVTDHLGNVRALLRDNDNRYVATMEDTEEMDYLNPRVEEMQYFENLFATEDENIYMNHTPPGVVEVPEKAAYLYWVDGMTGMDASDKGIGPSIALKVRPGDVIDIETWVRFERKETYARDFLLTALSSLLGNSFVNQAGFEGYTATQVANNINGALLNAVYPDGADDATIPYAYLNYVIYDENMVFKDAGWKRIGDDAGFYPNESGIMNDHQHLKFDAPVTINEKGYIYIWVSNQSEATKVWFDDLTVKYSGVYVTQATDYGVWGDVLREQKTDESIYRFGYQGQFSEKDLETGWNHFELREYDPVIGRWLVPDPMREHWSPYMSMGNNPVNIVDPDGGCEKCPKDGLTGTPGDITHIGVRDYIWDGAAWLPMSKEAVFEIDRFAFSQMIDQFVTTPMDAVSFNINHPKGDLFRDYSLGLIVFGFDGGGGPGFKRRDPNQNPAAPAFNLSWLLLFTGGRNEAEHGILTSAPAPDPHSTVHRNPDTTIYTNKRLNFYTRDGVGAGGYLIYDAFLVDKVTGDTLDRTYNVMKD